MSRTYVASLGFVPGAGYVFWGLEPGGSKDSFNPSDKAESYSPSVNGGTWTSMEETPFSSPPIFYSAYAVAAAIGQYIYVATGGSLENSSVSTGAFVSDYVFAFSPDTNGGIWTVQADAPADRSQAAGCTVASKMVVFGGRNATTLQNTIYVFTPASSPTLNSGAWATATANIGAARCNLAAAGIGGVGYVTGGDTGSTSNLFGSWTESTDTYAALTDVLPSGGTHSHGMFAISTKLYVVGGTGYSTVLREYDTAAPAAWATKTALPAPGRKHFTTFVAGGKGIVCGGRKADSDIKTSSDVDRYDPLANAWSTGTNMISERFGTCGCTL